MLLKKIFFNPTEALIYMERYVNNGSPSGFTWKYMTSSRTSSLYGDAFFLLNIMAPSMPRKETKIKNFGVIPYQITSHLNENEIFIHPDMCDLYMTSEFQIKKSSLKAIPLSSSRTVKLCDTPGFLKLNYNGIIGRIDRSLTEKHACCAVELSNLIVKIIDNESFSSLAIFPETGARVIKNNNVNIGMVYRDDKPYGINVSKIKGIIPLFSCFSTDRYHPEHDALIIQLIEMSGLAPKEYLIEQIIFPIIDNYFRLIRDHGLQPEWHAQNLLIGIDERCCVPSLIMRDMESIDIDSTIRDMQGLEGKLSFFPYKHIDKSQYNYRIKHSFMFDFKIGEYVFSPLIQCVCAKYNLLESSFQNDIRVLVNSYVKSLSKDFFPDNNEWYSFENILIDRSSPLRPYVKNINCKYRG